MDEERTAFRVGPLTDPGRYTLTHLLGSGGEGEVWRALGPDGPVAVKMQRLPGAEGEERLAHALWLEGVAAVRTDPVRGLVAVRELFVGPARWRDDGDPSPELSHQYVVMAHVEGLSLRRWLDEHPAYAQVRTRVRLLRRVAGTLSDLHGGSRRRPPLTHGDVKPANVVVTPEGRPVLVDLGLLGLVDADVPGPAGRTPAYSSPELRNPDAVAGPRSDTFSFAVTAMETLTGRTPPLDAAGRLDLPATVRLLREAPALRRRPLLRRRLVRALEIEPERRPATPARVFAPARLAAAGTAAVLVVGLAGGGAIAARDAGPEVARDPVAAPASVAPSPSTSDEVPSEVPGEVGGLQAAAPGDEALLAPEVDAGVAAERAAAEAAAAVPTVKPGKLLTVALTGGTSRSYRSRGGCGYVSNVIAEPSSVGSAWGSSSFTYALASRATVRVRAVRPIRTPAPQPRRLSQIFSLLCSIVAGVDADQDVCVGGGDRPPLRTRSRYVADLDRRTLEERSVRGQDSALMFGVTDCSTSSIDVTTRHCRGNLDYALELTYEKVSEPGVLYRQVLPPIRSRASVRDGRFTTTLMGLAPLSSRTARITTGPPGCTDRGVKARKPYPSAGVEIEDLLVLAVRERRQREGVGLAEAARRVAADAGSRPYTPEVILELCRRVVAQGRAGCGPEDPVASPSTSPSGAP